MVVYTTTGSEVSLVDTNKKSLFDNAGVEWARFPEEDEQEKFLLAYRETKANVSVIKLTKEEMKRVINGVHAMNTPTTVTEMRYYALGLPPKYQRVIDEWSDQKLREMLMDAEDHHQNPGAAMEAKVYTILCEEDRKREEELRAKKEAERPRPDTGEATGAQEAPRTARSTPKSRTQKGSLFVALSDTTVALTPKQLEFIERLSECPGFKEHGTSGSYIASQYAEELSDTMNPMSVGAVLTTLREKDLLHTEKQRFGGMKCCTFTLTELGKRVYNKLARIEG